MNWTDYIAGIVTGFILYALLIWYVGGWLLKWAEKRGYDGR
jgi:hypothetical protein